jgi:archaellin
MKSKFAFYEIIRVVSEKKELQKIKGKLGIITGKAQNETDPSIFSYAVDILNDDEDVIDGWCIYEEDLQATGKTVDSKKIFTGKSVKIQVNPKTGRGKIIEKE